MIQVLEELFTTISEFRSYVPTAESNVTFAELNSSATSARKQVISIISRNVYKLILADDGEKKESLKSAIANLTMSKQLVFDVIKQRKAETDVYKHELEAMKRAFIDNYYTSMDTLVSLLEGDAAFNETSYAKMIHSLPIKTAEEFNALHPIDMSYLFFYRTIPFQSEVYDQYSTYFSKLKDRPEELNRMKRAIAKLTIALSIRQLDILELPGTIRNLFDDSKVMRYGTQEQERMFVLSNELTAQAENIIRSIDQLIAADQATDIPSQTSFNRPEDKIYLLS